MVKLAKASKQATPKKKAPPPPKEEESSEEESSEEEEEEAPPPKKATPAKAPVKAVKNGKAAKKPESEEEDDDEDDSEEEESEEEAPPPKAAAKATPAKATPAKAPAAKAEESDDDDDEDDDEEESEEEAPPPVKAKGTPAKAPVKAAPAKEESEDDDDDEEDDSEEEMDTTPAAPAKKAGMVKAKEESEEDDDDEEEDDDDDDEEDDEDAPAKGKRKADAKKETPPAKKAKADGEGFCLFVGNLNPNKEYDEIKDALRKFFTKNDLETVDVRLGGSKRFGYVEFGSEEDLDKALELNGKKVLGMEMKLDKAKSKENSQQHKSERDAKTLFVKNLPFAATTDELKEIFDEAVDIRLPLGQNGSNRGIAYIEFKSEEAADKYLEAAQGKDVQGRSILVDYVGQKSQQNKAGAWGGAAAAGAPCKTLMVNNVAFSATEDVLQQAFEKSVSIRIPQNNGRSKGFAFVEFENEDDAKEAMESVNNTEIEGRTVRIEYSQQMGNRRESGGAGFGNSGPTKTLFVKGLSEDTTDETLRDSFEGSVGARIVTDRDTGSSKGFGFVDFDNEKDCEAAKAAMEEGEIDGNRVTLDYAKPKGDGGFRGGRGGGGFGGGGGFRGGRGGGGRGGGGFGGGRGGRGGGGFGGRGGGGRGGRGGGGGRGFGGGRGGGGGFGKPQGKKIKFDD